MRVPVAPYSPLHLVLSVLCLDLACSNRCVAVPRCCFTLPMFYEFITSEPLEEAGADIIPIVPKQKQA